MASEVVSDNAIGREIEGGGTGSVSLRSTNTMRAFLATIANASQNESYGSKNIVKLEGVG